MNSFRNPVKKSSFLWLIFCLICTSYQIYQLGHQYFQYDINTNVRLENPRQLVPPSAILCFETIYLVKWTELPKDVLDKIIGGVDVPFTEEGYVDPTKITFFPKLKVASHLFENFAISVFFNNLTYSFHEIFVDVPFFFYDPNTNAIKIGVFDQYYEVTTFVRDNLKCFTLDVREEWRKNLTYNKIRRQAVVSTVMSSLSIRTEMLPYIRETFYMFGLRGGVIQAGFSSLLIIPTLNGTVKGVSYEEYEEHLLGPPFDTWCRNYSDSPNENGDIVRNTDECYEQCARQLTLNTIAKHLPGITTFENETASMVPFDSFYRNDELITTVGGKIQAKDLFNYVDDHCEYQCRQKDCIKKIFIPRPISTNSQPDESDFTLNLFIRQTPVLLAICLPQYSFTQFGTDLFSTVGFWLGLSAFASLSHVINIYKIIFRKTLTNVEDKTRKRNRRTESRTDNVNRSQPSLQNFNMVSKQEDRKHTECLPTHRLQFGPAVFHCARAQNINVNVNEPHFARSVRY